ncbi:MAG: hypothetical protein JXL84_09290 [Deltaproteobacteria bacterium]|nr:hypothetical protein [Deltaproteobacteria bacterium]
MEIMMSKTALLDQLWPHLEKLDDNAFWALERAEKLMAKSYASASIKALAQSILWNCENAMEARDAIVQFLEKEKRSRAQVRVNKAFKRIERLTVIEGRRGNV